ncbi:MAG: hypothetical protein H6925_04500 [Holosporaceae bacterium]|nr:MAG: hypothetical protein H6925_04500 [Holosporaceae bacterium]
MVSAAHAALRDQEAPPISTKSFKPINRIESVEVLAQALPYMQGITSLDLSNSHISDEGIKALAKVLPNTRITELNLDGIEPPPEHKNKELELDLLLKKLPETKIKDLHLEGLNLTPDK